MQPFARATHASVACLLALLLPGSAREARAEPPRTTLPECIEIALANQPRLGAAAAIVEAGRQRVFQTRANYLPQLDASYSASRRKSASRSFDGSTTSPSGFGSSGASSFYSTGFTLSQLLFDFGANLDAIRAARARADSLESDAITERETTIFDVKQAYFDLLAAQRLLGVAEETLRSDRKQLELAQGRYDVGLAAKIDVTRSEVQAATSQLAVITARNNVAVARDTLGNAMGLSEPIDFEITDVDTVERVSMEESQALADAYASRPELASNLALQRAAELEILAKRKQHLPNLTGNAAYEWSGSDYPLRDGWLVGGNLNFPLFSGGRISAEVGEAMANLDRLRFDETGLRQDISLEVSRALLELQRAAESIDVTRRSSEQARENLELAEGRYETGVGNIIELTDAQSQRARSDAEHVRALYGYQIAIAALERAIGQPLARP